MTVVDVMLRSRCDIADPCGRASSNHVRNMPLESEYDFIVVGGGVAGPVAAGRLAENPKWKVLLLEAGPDEPTVTSVPGFAASAVGTNLDWQYTTEKNKNACLVTGGICKWPRGKMLAGTGAMTGMMYTRSHASIYDEWERQGNPGWGFSDVLEYFIKSEQNMNPDLVEKSYHGFNGPLKVQRFNTYPNIGDDIFKAGREQGYTSTDFNGGNQLGVNIAQVMVDNGVRSSTPRMYLRDKYSKGNLKVQLNAHVMKINVDPITKRAVSVQFKDMKTNEIKIVEAKKEIIMTAGTIGTPQLLMLSGIGPKPHLDQLGIKTISDLRVGYNLMHHVGANLQYSIKENDLRALDFNNLNDYLNHRNGTLANTGLTQLTAFFRSRFSKIRDIQVFFDAYSTDCSYTGFIEECGSGKMMQDAVKNDGFVGKLRNNFRSGNQLMKKQLESFVHTTIQKKANIENEFDKVVDTVVEYDKGMMPSVWASLPATGNELSLLSNNVKLDRIGGLFNKSDIPLKFQDTMYNKNENVKKDDAIQELIANLQLNLIETEVESTTSNKVHENQSKATTANPALLSLNKMNENKEAIDKKSALSLTQPTEGIIDGKGSTNITHKIFRRSIFTNPFHFYEPHKEEELMPCGRRTVSLRPTNLLPISTGRIMLSSTNPFDYPKIQSNYLSVKQDVDVILDGIRHVQNLTRAKALEKWDFQLDSTVVPECKQFKWDSDSYWECYIKTYTLPENHPSGACKMGPPSDHNSVVDPELRVLGVSNLRVMDASIFPTNINSNPIATIIMIAEKGVDFIKETWN